MFISKDFDGSDFGSFQICISNVGKKVIGQIFFQKKYFSHLLIVFIKTNAVLHFARQTIYKPGILSMLCIIFTEYGLI